MQVLVLDGHPDAGRLVTHLLDRYAAALDGAHVERVALRDLAFSPNLRRGYAEEQPLEPDLARLAGLLTRAITSSSPFPCGGAASRPW